MGKNDLFDYELECINAANYELKLLFRANSVLFQRIYNKSAAKLRKDRGLAVGKSEIEEFDIPPQYLNLIKIAVRKPYNKVFKIFREDKIELLDFKVEKTKFRKNGEHWDIFVLLTGMYADKR